MYNKENKVIIEKAIKAVEMAKEAVELAQAKIMADEEARNGGEIREED